MDAIEAVERALYDCEVNVAGWGVKPVADAQLAHEEVRALAQAALSAARPFIATECAKVAEDEAKAWKASGCAAQAMGAFSAAKAIKETIR